MSSTPAGTGSTIITITVISASASRIVGRKMSRRESETTGIRYPCGSGPNSGRPSSASGTSEPSPPTAPDCSSG